jgi:NAD(P)-dependent dehydrogenase (short-subunit alcohol dehydrogenase family)
MMRALVTGGSGSIGAAVCRTLASAGHHVLVHTHSQPDKAAAIVAGITEAGGSAEAVQFDVADGDATALVLQHLLEQGPIQILVNNAGRNADAPLAGMSRAQWSGDRRDPQRLLSRHSAASAADDTHALRRIVNVVGGGPGEQPRADELRGSQGGTDRRRQGARPRSRVAGHHREFDRAWHP